MNKKKIKNSFVYKNLFCKNIILEQFIYKIMYLCFPKNLIIRRLIKKVEKIDSISDYDKFVETISPYLKYKGKISFFLTGLERYPYGYYREIMNYAKIKKIKVPVFTELEHGISFGKDVCLFDVNAISYVSQGEYQFEEIEQYSPNIPKYAVGPYILYSRDYYGEEKIREYKEKLGKTLLVIPSHTWEGDSADRDTDSLINIVYSKYASGYDSVLVCVYWNDINSPDYARYREKGATLVSAGYREDPLFVQRLKTIIKLSDAVVGDDLGTNIGFCYALGKVFYLETNFNRYDNEPLYSHYYPIFRKAFYSADMSFTKEQLSEQAGLYNLFWGGDERIKTPQELKEIIIELLEEVKKGNFRYDLLGASRRRKKQS